MGALTALPEFTKETFLKRRNTMSKDTKKVDKKAEKGKPKAKAAELSEKDLEQVAGGGTTTTITRNADGSQTKTTVYTK